MRLDLTWAMVFLISLRSSATLPAWLLLAEARALPFAFFEGREGPGVGSRRRWWLGLLGPASMSSTVSTRAGGGRW